MPSPSITAVIPVFNRAELLARLLGSVRAQSVPFEEVLVVDNGSTDDAPAVAERFGCRVIAMGENTGFARAVNRGWQAADAEWIAILNSDVELDPGWAERMLGACAADGDTPSYATGLILDAVERNRIDGTYDLVSRGACAWRAGHGADAAAFTTPSRVAIVPATACLFRRAALDKLGGFDVGFESYLEDVDLGLRCIEAGLTGLYVPDALAWHRGSATLGRWNARVVRLTSRNQLRLVARHYDSALFRRCLRQIVAGQLLWGLVALRHGAGWAWIQGKLEGLRGFRLEGRGSERLGDFLIASETEIRGRATGSYWRWYFRLA